MAPPRRHHLHISNSRGSPRDFVGTGIKAIRPKRGNRLIDGMANLGVGIGGWDEGREMRRGSGRTWAKHSDEDPYRYRYLSPWSWDQHSTKEPVSVEDEDENETLWTQQPQPQAHWTKHKNNKSPPERDAMRSSMRSIHPKLSSLPNSANFQASDNWPAKRYDYWEEREARNGESFPHADDGEDSDYDYDDYCSDDTWPAEPILEDREREREHESWPQPLRGAGEGWMRMQGRRYPSRYRKGDYRCRGYDGVELEDGWGGREGDWDGRDGTTRRRGGEIDEPPSRSSGISVDARGVRSERERNVFDWDRSPDLPKRFVEAGWDQNERPEETIWNNDGWSSKRRSNGEGGGISDGWGQERRVSSSIEENWENLIQRGRVSREDDGGVWSRSRRGVHERSNGNGNDEWFRSSDSRSTEDTWREAQRERVPEETHGGTWSRPWGVNERSNGNENDEWFRRSGSRSIEDTWRKAHRQHVPEKTHGGTWSRPWGVNEHSNENENDAWFRISDSRSIANAHNRARKPQAHLPKSTQHPQSQPHSPRAKPINNKNKRSSHPHPPPPSTKPSHSPPLAKKPSHSQPHAAQTLAPNPNYTSPSNPQRAAPSPPFENHENNNNNNNSILMKDEEVWLKSDEVERRAKLISKFKLRQFENEHELEDEDRDGDGDEDRNGYEDEIKTLRSQLAKEKRKTADLGRRLVTLERECVDPGSSLSLFHAC